MHTPLRTHRLAFVAAASLLSLSAQAETYTWTEGATAPWASTLSWTPMGIPTAGDWVEIPGVSTAEISGTCTVGGMDLWNVQLNGTSSDSTLSINSGDGSPSIVHSRQSSAIGIADNDPNLTLHLANPTAFYLYPNQNGSGSYPSIMYLSKLSGGTEEAPCDITLVRGRHFFRNASNNFRGNIIVGGENAGTQFFCGYRSSPAADTMLGHPDNIVYLSAGSRIAWQSSSDPLNHKVFGNGTIYGTNFDSWGNFTGANLYLGQDFEVRPETATSPFSSITIRNDFDYSKNSGTIHINPEATFSFNTGSTQADHIQVITYKAMEIRGHFVITEVEPVAPDTTYTLMTINAGAGSVTWNPTSTPEGYSVKFEGSGTVGWTLSATKLREGANVTTLTPVNIGDTYGSAHAEITSIVPAGEVTLRAYYGTTDGGDNPAAWDAVVVYPDTDLSLGRYAIPLPNLVLGETYFTRASVENSAGENFAAESVSFTTQVWETPDVFTWVPVADLWSAEGAWTTDTPYARKTPGFAGDTIRIITGSTYGNEVGQNRTLTLDQDYTIQTLLLTDGYQRTVTLTAPDAPVTLTFDSTDPVTPNSVNSVQQLTNLNLGTSLDDGLSIVLKQSLRLLRNNAWGVNYTLWAPISGGSTETPTPISAESVGNEYCNLYINLMNEANSWIGDFTVGSAESHNSTVELRVGSANIPSVNSMLGDPTNALFMGNRSTIRFYAPSSQAFNLERTIGGQGTVYGSINNNTLGAFHLTDSARLAPCGKTGAGFGSITVRAATLTFDPAATIALDLGVEENDNIVFESSSALTLSARFEFTPEVTPVIPGTTWSIGTVQKAPSLSLAGLTSPGYRVYVEQDHEAATTTYLLYAEKLPESTLLLLR